jgi:hypothetical protein
LFLSQNCCVKSEKPTNSAVLYFGVTIQTEQTRQVARIVERGNYERDARVRIVHRRLTEVLRLDAAAGRRPDAATGCWAALSAIRVFTSLRTSLAGKGRFV